MSAKRERHRYKLVAPAAVPRDSNLSKSALRFLAKSGIDTKAAARCGLESLNRHETGELLERPTFEHESILFPYRGWDGAETGFYRLRPLATPFGAEPEFKYWQPPKTSPKLYIPPVPTGSWREIQADTAQPLVICEGEKKAIAASLRGLNAVGLGGLNSYQSKRLGIPLLRELDEIKLEGREVFIVFDSDVEEREDLLPARDGLAVRLVERGALVSIVSVPPSPSLDKTGLDDHFMSGGRFEDLPRAPHQISATFQFLNQRYAYLESHSGRVLRLEDCKIVRARDFYIEVAHLPYESVTMRGPKRANAGEAWIEWAYRRTVRQIMFLPRGVGESPTSDHLEGPDYNTWAGWPVAPKRGDIAPYLELRSHLMRSGNAAAPERLREFQYIEKWVAFKLRNPQEKIPIVVIVTGRQGTGKTALGNLLGALFEPHTILIGGERLTSRFNAHLQNPLFARVDELQIQDKKIAADIFKNMISAKNTIIEPKGVDPYSLPDYTQYFVTSNHANPMFLEPDDRRAFMFEACEGLSDEEARIPTAVVGRVERLIASPEGVAALLDHFMRIELADFDAHSAPPMTAAKLGAIEDSPSETEQFARDVIADPEHLWSDWTPTANGLMRKPCDLGEAADLIALHHAPDSVKRAGRVAMGIALKKAGAVRVNRGLKVRTQNGLLSLWAIRNPERWRRATHEELAAHYDAALPAAQEQAALPEKPSQNRPGDRSRFSVELGGKSADKADPRPQVDSLADRMERNR